MLLYSLVCLISYGRPLGEVTTAGVGEQVALANTPAQTINPITASVDLGTVETKTSVPDTQSTAISGSIAASATAIADLLPTQVAIKLAVQADESTPATKTVIGDQSVQTSTQPPIIVIATLFPTAGFAPESSTSIVEPSSSVVIRPSLIIENPIVVQPTPVIVQPSPIIEVRPTPTVEIVTRPSIVLPNPDSRPPQQFQPKGDVPLPSPSPSASPAPVNLADLIQPSNVPRLQSVAVQDIVNNPTPEKKSNSHGLFVESNSSSPPVGDPSSPQQQLAVIEQQALKANAPPVYNSAKTLSVSVLFALLVFLE